MAAMTPITRYGTGSYTVQTGKFAIVNCYVMPVAQGGSGKASIKLNGQFLINGEIGSTSPGFGYPVEIQGLVLVAGSVIAVEVAGGGVAGISGFEYDA